MQETQNRSTFNVLFIIKKAKLLKNGEAPICMRVTVNKQVVEILVKRSIDIKEWNQVKGCSKAKTNAGREDLLLREINSEYVTEFEFYLKKVKECQHNTTIKHLKKLKKVIRIALTNDWLKKDPFMGIHFKHTEVHPEFLTQEELTRLMDKKFVVERIGVIRDIYGLCAFTDLSFMSNFLKTNNLQVEN